MVALSSIGSPNAWKGGFAPRFEIEMTPIYRIYAKKKFFVLIATRRNVRRSLSSAHTMILPFFAYFWSVQIENVYNRNAIARHTAAKNDSSQPFDQRMSIFFHSFANRLAHYTRKLRRGKLFEWKIVSAREFIHFGWQLVTATSLGWKLFYFLFLLLPRVTRFSLVFLFFVFTFSHCF